MSSTESELNALSDGKQENQHHKKIIFSRWQVTSCNFSRSSEATPHLHHGWRN
jgi:hypothetical protein